MTQIRRKIKPELLGDAPLVWTPIDAIDMNGMKGWIQVGISQKWNIPRRYDVSFDDLLDLCEAMEAITLEHGGRVYRRQAPIVAPERLAIEKIVAGKIDIAPTAIPPDWEPGHGYYLGVVMKDAERTTYHNFFVHLEDLVALLHATIKDAQGLNKVPAAVAVAQASNTVH